MNVTDTAINTTFIGFAIVFIALILLFAVIFIYSKIVQRKKTKNIVSLEAVGQDEKNEAMDKDEIAAVIIAAIAAVSARKPDVNIKIRSIRRTSTESPIWNKSGRLDYLSDKL